MCVCFGNLLDTYIYMYKKSKKAERMIFRYLIGRWKFTTVQL